MKKTVGALVCIIFISSVVLIPFANADWAMFRADPSHTGIGTENSPFNSVPFWSFNTSSSVTSSPAVVDGVVYIGSGDGNVYALNCADGIQLWKFNTINEDDSSPAVVDGVVYVGSFGPTATQPSTVSLVADIYALNATDGTELWNYVTGVGLSSPRVDNGVFSSNAVSPCNVVNGVVYFGSADDHIYALNASDGSQLWNYSTGYWAVSSPAFINGIVFVGSDDSNVYALNASGGAQLWNYTTGGYVYSSPAVIGGTVYVGSEDGSVYALNATSGTQLWNYTTGKFVDSSPAIVNGAVYIGSGDGNIYALNAANGIQLWNYTTGGVVVSSPAVANGIVYVGSEDGNVYALNANTGAKLWNYNTGNWVESSPAVVNGVVYVGSVNGDVYALNATSPPTSPPTATPTPLPTPTPVPKVNSIVFSSGLTLYSPVNTTYNSNVVECNGTFNCPKGVQSSLNYSIDGQYQGGLPWSLNPNSIPIPEYYTVNGSFQLPQLPNGSHQLSIGIDEELYSGNITADTLISQTTWVNTVYFTIDSSQPTPTLTPTLTPNITPTPTPTVPEFNSAALILVMATGVIAVTFVHLKSKRKAYL